MRIKLAVDPKPEGQLGDKLGILNNLHKTRTGPELQRRSSWVDKCKIVYLGSETPPCKHRMAEQEHIKGKIAVEFQWPANQYKATV